MKKLLFFLLFPFIINAQITLSGSNLFFSVPRLYSCSDIIGTISFNGTYTLDGTSNGKNQYSMSVSNPNRDGIVCFNTSNSNSGIGLYGSKIYIRWNATALNWNIGFIGQIGPNTFTFFTLATLSGDTSDPPCGLAFGGTISGASCIQNCTNSMTVTGSTTICSGVFATLTATGCSGIVSWNNNGGTGASISVSPTTTTTYIATCSTEGVCSGSATVTVNMIPPTPQIIATGSTASGTDVTICAGTAISLYCGGCTYIENGAINWSNGTTSTETYNSSVPFVPLLSTTYYATRSANGCTSPSSNIVSVTVIPSITVSASNSTICSGTSTTLTATGCSGIVTWSNGGATGSSITVSPNSTITYTASCSISGVCDGTTTITVKYTPSKPVINSNNTSYCSGTTALLSVNCNYGNLISWNNGATTAQISTTTNGVFTATCTENGCTSLQSSSFPIDFHSTPTISGTTCVGSMLTATGFGSASIQWVKDGIELTGATTATFTPTQSGNYQVVTTSLKGSWAVVTSPTNQSINGVYFVDAAQGWIVGGGGIIYKTINGGSSWSQQTSGLTNSLNSVFFTNATNGVSVGSNGKILRTTDGGSTWTSITSNTTNNLFDVYFTDANNGWAVGGQYVVLKTTNGGVSWTISSIDNAASIYDYYSEVQFTDANTGYVSGGKSDYSDGFVRKTTNGGTTWNNSFSQTNGSFMFGLSFINSNIGWIGGAIAGSAPYAQKTTNGGTNWSNISFSGLNVPDAIRALYFIDANRGWVIASNNIMGNSIYSTRDGGNTFTREYVTNASQASSIATSRDVFMLPDGNSGWVVGYNPSFGNGFLMKFSNKACSSNSITINNTPNAPTLNLSGTQAICPNASINLTASACSGTVTWSNAATGTSLTINSAGTYTATCTNACGTSIESSALIVTSIPISQTLSGTATNGTQQASQSIVSTQTINSNINTNYKAGNSVTLNPTFQTQTGAVFKAEIGGCN